jgi:hypothetical protein
MHRLCGEAVVPGYQDRRLADAVEVPDKEKLNKARVIAAFVLTPFLAALAFAAAFPLYGGLPHYLDRVVRSAMLYWIFGALPWALLFGIPAYLVLKKVLLPRLLWCALAGAIIAALPWLLLGLNPSADQASVGGRATVINGDYTAFGWQQFAQSILVIAAGGAAGGAIFWLIAAAKWPLRRS